MHNDTHLGVSCNYVKHNSGNTHGRRCKGRPLYTAVSLPSATVTGNVYMCPRALIGGTVMDVSVRKATYTQTEWTDMLVKRHKDAV